MSNLHLARRSDLPIVLLLLTDSVCCDAVHVNVSATHGGGRRKSWLFEFVILKNVR